MNMKTGGKILASGLLVAAIAAGRLLPHPWNFTPLMGLTLASGAYLGWRWAGAVSFTALAVSDAVLGGYDWRLQAVVYGTTLLVALGSVWLGRGRTVRRAAASAAAAAGTFYLLTNGAVWAFSSWYPKTPDGLLSCYAAGLPFFRNALAGDLLYAILGCLAFETALSLRLGIDRHSAGSDARPEAEGQALPAR